MTRARALTCASLACVAVVALAACTPDTDDDGAWPSPVGAAMVTVSAPDPDTWAGEQALIVVGPDGVVEWHDAVGPTIAKALDTEDPGWWSVEAVASDARAALVTRTVPDSYSAREWYVWDLATDALQQVTCEDGDRADVWNLLEPRADSFVVQGNCDGPVSVATIDARTAILSPGPAAPFDDSQMWLPDRDNFLTVEGAPGPCRYVGHLTETELAVTCDTTQSNFMIGVIDLETADAATGSYSPHPEWGEYEQFWRSTAFVHDGRLYINSNTVEGTPLLQTDGEGEFWLTALAPVGEQVFMARGLDPYGPQSQGEPALGWYDPATGEFTPMPLPEGVPGVWHSASGVPLG